MTSIGEQFERERIGKKVSLEDVARETKIRINFLQAIEEDRFDLLPGRVFARNFLRAYARYLEMDEKGVVKSFDQRFPKEEGKKLAPSRLMVEEFKRKRSFYHIVLLIILVLLLGYLLWVKGWDFKGENFYNLQQKRNTSATKREPALPPEKEEVSITTRELSAETGGLSMELRAIDLCWVEVLADEKLVAYRLLQPGEQLSFIALQGFSLTLGNAGGMEIILNGERLRPLGSLGEVKRGIILNTENWRQYIMEDNQ